jgi:hypothetical protein
MVSQTCGAQSRAARVSAVPIMAAAVSQIVAVVTMLVFRANTRQPWSLTVANGITRRGLAIVRPDAENENGADQWNHPDEHQLPPSGWHCREWIA